MKNKKKPDLKGKGLAFCESLYGQTAKKSTQKLVSPPDNTKPNYNSNCSSDTKGTGASQKPSPPPCPDQKQQ